MITMKIMLWSTAAWGRSAVAMAKYGVDTGIGVFAISKDLSEKSLFE